MSALQTTTELLRLLSEPTRVRLLALLGREELTVAELTGVTQLSQSRVSTHLGKLREAGFVRDDLARRMLSFVVRVIQIPRPESGGRP